MSGAERSDPGRLEAEPSDAERSDPGPGPDAELCPGVREFSHTADLGIEVEAPSLEELFERAGKGMMALLQGSDEPDLAERQSDERVVRIRAPDLPALLVRWLGELLHFRDEGLAFRGAAFERLEEARLEARVRVAPEGRPPIREIKGVTYHGLEVREAEGAWSARVIFDV